MMTKKHFKAMATAFNTYRGFDAHSESMRKQLAIEMATICKNDNSNFDRTKFLQACGVEETKTKKETGPVKSENC